MSVRNPSVGAFKGADAPSVPPVQAGAAEIATSEWDAWSSDAMEEGVGPWESRGEDRLCSVVAQTLGLREHEVTVVITSQWDGCDPCADRQWWG